jgi:serine/threonine protein kinase
MSAVLCPEEHELLTLVAGGPVPTMILDHLDHCRDCQQRKARLSAEVTTLRKLLGDLTPGPADSGLAADPSIPSTIGKYHILEKLGRGGQADVYRALHPTLRKEVVIKLCRKPFGADRNAIAAEGKVLAELDHPGLARVYDLDFHEDRPFLVMDYVRACNLQQYVAHQRLTPQRAAGLIAKAARALTVAHRLGFVHQDLKPNNILIGEAGEPRIIDFGMARLSHGWIDSHDQPDGGTASFMAPEQARGEVDRIGPASDVFALGGVLYFLLTGQPPFAGAALEERLKRASRCDFDREALAGVPRQLRSICLRAMAAEPSDRYASAVDFALCLERFGSRRGRRAALLIAVSAALLTITAVLWAKYGNDRPTHQPAMAPPLPLPENPMSIRIFRGGEFRDLNSPGQFADMVPLTAGDELQIRAQVPEGLHASLFAIEGGGRCRHLGDGAPGRLLLYPPESGRFVPLEGEAGTELLLVCWRRRGPATVEEFSRFWNSDASWPALPRDSVLRFDLEGVHVVQKGRPLGMPRSRPDPEGEIHRRLEELRQQLRDHFDYVFGIAFAHQPESRNVR